MQQEIINAVDAAIEKLADLFTRQPTQFFTENDLVCGFHRLVTDSLKSVGLTFSDKEGLPHTLIHGEYPTPFRCDMSERGFQEKGDEDRTATGKKYKRGHYDIVVLNPEFIGRHSYSQIKCQDFDEFLSEVAPRLTDAEPMILYGVELVFSRDLIPLSKGHEPERAARAFVEEVVQDTKKLIATVAKPKFMKQAAMLAFTKGTSREVNNLIRTLLRNQIPCERTARLIDAYSAADGGGDRVLD